MSGMKECEIKEALDFCTGILDLPETCSRVINLSGGQKRRVSFAVAVMHNPSLVILDEPTVGVDPLVRERIWNHLKYLSKTKGSTVIITTHYTDEARHSDMVGVMRNGSLIVEKSPGDLLLEHNTNSLETVVLCLCKAMSHQGPSPTIPTPYSVQCSSPSFQPSNSEISGQIKEKTLKERFARTRALVKKNGYLWQRHAGLFMMSILFPAIGIFLLVKCLGTPNYIHFGVVNEELNVSETCDDSSKIWNKTCDVSLWSCKFLSNVLHQEFVLHEYNSSQDTENAVRLGDIWGFILFPHNFSENLYERATVGVEDDRGNINGSNIFVILDRTNAVITGQINFALFTAYENFLKSILNECGLDPRIGEYSLQYNTPIIGKGASYGLFAVPGSIISYMFFWPIITSGIRFVNEKQEGTMKRSIVGGIQLWEVYLSYCVVETIVALLRMAIVYSVASWLLQMEILGALLPQGVLGLLATFMGVGSGLVVGLLCTVELQVALVVLTFYAMNWLLSGIMWPLEGMSQFLKKVGYCLPCTLSGDAMRSMFNRGWGLDNVHVWAGFVASVGYILVFFLGAIVISRRKLMN